MQQLRRGLAAAALLAISLTGAQASAQESNTQAGTVGPAELRDFSLPGQRTTPPATPPQPAPQAETPRPTVTTPPAAATPRPAETRPAPTRPAAEAPRPAERSAAPAAPAASTPIAPAETGAASPAPLPDAAVPQQPVAVDPLPVTVGQTPPAPEQPASPAEHTSGWSWLWLALPAALALGAFLALRRRRGEAAEVHEDEEVAPETVEQAVETEPAPRRLAETLPPAPKPAAKPALKLPPKVRAVPPAPPQAVGPRAVLEVEFIPARASATADAAVVEFELVLKNVGDVPACNIRIDTRMFNASATKEMAEFLKGPIHDESGSPHVRIAPGEDLRLQSAMAMPKQDVREILMQGQRLFVPAVASIVAWDWGTDGRARSALSWLVGRETENKAAKMGAFRLDQGPRIYRQVGVRPLKLVA